MKTSLVILGSLVLGMGLSVLPRLRAEEARPAEGTVHVASLVYAGGKTSKCFAANFLATVDRETRTRVDRAFHTLELTKEDLFNYPFAVMTGEGAFKLSDAEVLALKTYLNRGGFILASAGCSSAEWAASFKEGLARAFPEGKLKAVTLEHPMFHTIFDVKGLRGKSQEAAEIDVLEIGGRVAVVFSAMGLNDTANAGGGCCCCGGNEIRDAQIINADILAYALTH